MIFAQSNLSDLEPYLIQYLKTPNTPTNQVIEHIFSSGGKRLRPYLFLLVCQLLDYHGEHKYSIAAVCEYIHTASLLHDDVIDNSTLRRNKPTVNSIWGDETAVLAGDLIYSTACRLMVKTRSLNLIDTFAECIRLMSESELYQLDLLWKSNIQIENYFKVVEGKTAILFEACAKCPCYLLENKVQDDFVKPLAEFGKKIGIAFQIADDCLDYSSDTHLVGKPLLADLDEGKLTLPLIYAMQKDNLHLTQLVSLFFEGQIIKHEDKLKLLGIMQGLGVVEQALTTAKKLVEEGQQALTQAFNIINNPSDEQRQAYSSLLSLSSFFLSRNN